MFGSLFFLFNGHLHFDSLLKINKNVLFKKTKQWQAMKNRWFTTVWSENGHVKQNEPLIYSKIWFTESDAVYPMELKRSLLLWAPSAKCIKTQHPKNETENANGLKSNCVFELIWIEMNQLFVTSDITSDAVSTRIIIFVIFSETFNGNVILFIPPGRVVLTVWLTWIVSLHMTYRLGSNA